MIIVAIAIIMFLGCDNTKKQSRTKDQSTTTTDVTTETSVITSATSTTTTTDTTSSSTSTTTISATTATTITVATTEYTEEEETVFVEVKEEPVEEIVKEYIPTTEEYQHTSYTETETVTIPVTEEETYCEETQSNMTINYSINQLTYYSGPKGCKGRWGRTLLNNYSIASNLLPDGTIVHIESNDGSINGDYRVDDTGGMGNNVIDIFYTNYSNVPYPFSRDGRISCTVWVYE
jgi:hypothetical protein